MRILPAAACLLILMASAASAQMVSPVPDPIWDGRLWLTSQALGLAQDCTVRALFQQPRFRSTADPVGAEVTSRLVSTGMSGGDLYLAIETLRAGAPLQRVVLQLRAHPAEGVVSVESIRVAGAPGEGTRTLTYREAVEDDEDYDVYTDTLVSLYQAFFDGREVRGRLSGPGR